MQAHLTEVDVAIVGYGPTGQALAALLGQAGWRVGVYERWPSLYTLPRACVIDHEAMRILQSVGVAERFAPLTVPTSGDYVWLNAEGRTLYHFRYAREGLSGWPARQLMYQPDLEVELDRRVRALPNIDLQQGWQAVGIESRTDGVTLHLAEHGAAGEAPPAEGARRSVRARWLVGADGANSFIREAAGLDLTDLGFRADWLVVDFRPHDPTRLLDMPEAGQICDPCRPVTLMRQMGHRHVRWEMMLLPGERAEEMCRPERVWPMLARWVTPDDGLIERAAVYTFRSALAPQWHRGRTVLAGDAAHLMPPFLGQGLCAGLRDARALAWRLDALLRGAADASWLDAYQAERRQHVGEVIDRAVALGKVVCITDPVAARRRDEAILAGSAPAVPPFPVLRPGPVAWLSDAPEAGQLAPQPTVRVAGGERRLDDLLGTGWQLLLLAHAGRYVPDEATQAFLRRIGLTVSYLRREADGEADVGAEGAWTDVDDRLHTHLGERGLVGLLVRPDFYVYAGVTDLAALPALVEGLRVRWTPALGHAEAHVHAHA